MSAYESSFDEFDSPLMRQFRRDAYGEDIGQHSWVTAGELRGDIERLRITPASRILDLGCGPCGPLTYILGRVGCRGTGVDISHAALQSGHRRADALGRGSSLELRQADLDGPIPLDSGSFDAAISMDVVVHLRDRATLFREAARLLKPRGRLLVTDANVVTGLLSSEEMARRSLYGHTQFVPPGCNEERLEASGFRLLEVADRSHNAVDNASGRLAAIRKNRVALEHAWGAGELERQRRYLETVVELCSRRALSRVAYLAEVLAA